MWDGGPTLPARRAAVNPSSPSAHAGPPVHASTLTLMAVDTPTHSFDPATFTTFRFVSRDLDEGGRVDVGLRARRRRRSSSRRSSCPSAAARGGRARAVDGLLSLLHWVAGRQLLQDGRAAARALRRRRAAPAAAALLEALYSEGLGEFAYVNAPPRRCRGRASPTRAGRRPPAGAPAGHAPRRGASRGACSCRSAAARTRSWRSRRSAARAASSRCSRSATPTPIARTAAVAGLPRLIARRQLDPGLARAQRAPARSTATCRSPRSSSLHRAADGRAQRLRRGRDGQRALGLERQPVVGRRRGQPSVQQEPARRAPAARRRVAELAPRLQLFSILRPASELAIARAFARLERTTRAFTSCNAIFRLDPARRAASWCCDCPKCRFVFLVLAPFSEPAAADARCSARDLLEDEAQFDGFALLTATGGAQAVRVRRRGAARASRRSACSPTIRAGATTRRRAARRRGAARPCARRGRRRGGARAERRARRARRP